MTIISAHNGGEMIGIICIALLKNGLKISCSLTHLDFPKSTVLYNEIIDSYPVRFSYKSENNKPQKNV